MTVGTPLVAVKPKTPWISVILVAINIVVAFWVQLVRPDWIGTHGFTSTLPTIPDSITGLFIHQNVLHLGGNMVALLAVGTWVEDALGRWKFAGLYLAGGIAGVALHWIATRNSGTAAPLIGASGCVAALVAYGSVRYMWSKVTFAPRIKVPVVMVAGFWIALQALGAFVKLGDTGGVSFWAHLGGIIAGLAIAMILGAPKQASLQHGRRILADADTRSASAVVAAATEHLKTHEDDLVALIELAEAYQQLGDGPAEIKARTNILQKDLDADLPNNIDRLHQLGGLAQFPSVQRCKWAETLFEQHANSADVLLHSVVDGPDSDPQKPDAMLTLARRLESTDPAESNRLIEQLIKNFPLHPATAMAQAKGRSR